MAHPYPNRSVAIADPVYFIKIHHCAGDSCLASRVLRRRGKPAH
jgi:hypothetical protein